MGSLELHELRRFDGDCILSVAGEIDETTVEAFEFGVAAGRVGSRALVVDLTECKVSSAGMTALRHLHRSTSDRVPMTLVVRDSYLLRMFDVVGLTAKFGTHPTVGAALSSNTQQARTNGSRTRRTGRLKLVAAASAPHAVEQQPTQRESRGLRLIWQQ